MPPPVLTRAPGPLPLATMPAYAPVPLPNVNVLPFRLTVPPGPASDAKVGLTPVPRFRVPLVTVTFDAFPKAVVLFTLKVPVLNAKLAPAVSPGDAAPKLTVPPPVAVRVRAVPPSLIAPTVVVSPAAVLSVGFPVIEMLPSVRPTPARPVTLSVLVPIDTLPREAPAVPR